MILPVAIICLATICAAIVAYGVHPDIAQFHHGIDMILLARRFQWPMAALSLILCLVLIALAVSGRRRAWFLIGLGPVLALFAHHFKPSARIAAIEENPAFVSADEAQFLRDDDFVVGIRIGDTAFAYPYAELFDRPVIIQADREKKTVLIWSAYANRAVACNVSRELRGRDLEVVSTPANSPLIYNTRLGEFIFGVTGLTRKGSRPTGFETPIATSKMIWSDWRRENPGTRVLAPPPPGMRAGAPTRPVLPAYPMPRMDLDRPAQLRIALFGQSKPVAIDSDSIAQVPLNFSVDGIPLVVFRLGSGEPVRAFDRRLPNDLRPRFDLNRAQGRHHGVGMFVDGDTGSTWNADGVWVDGLKSLKGQKLSRFPVEDDLYWGVMKFWMPDLTLQTGPDASQ